MTFAFLTLLAALSLAAVADWFSIIGFMAIYAAAPIPALIMGIVLALAKLVTTSWVYRNWKYADWRLKIPLIGFVLALMIATSIGTFGFLSKAHLEQGASTIDNSAKVERLDQQIAREKSTIVDNEKVVSQLDATINSYIGKDRTDKSLSVRRSQAPQRKQLRDDIDAAQKRIDGYSDERLKLQSEVRKQQLDVGPIRYIAELFYGVAEDSSKNIEAAVRIFTLLIVSTLDPLAVILLVAANHTLLRLRDEKDKKTPKVEVPDTVKHGAGDLAAESNDKEACQTSPHGASEKEAVFVREIPPSTPRQQTQTVYGNNTTQSESEIPLPVLPETLEVLDEINAATVEKIDPSVELSTRLGSTDNEQEALPPSGTTTIYREPEVADENNAEEEIQEVMHEEEDPALEEIEENWPKSSDKIFPVIRAPRLTRVSARTMLEETQMDDQVQEQPAQTHVTPHFIPQKVNEEENSTSQEGSPAWPGTDITEPQPSPLRAAEAQEVFAKATETKSLYKENLPRTLNKYPITLSWLAEFKKV